MHLSKSTPTLRSLIAAGILALPISVRAQAYSWTNGGDGLNLFGSGTQPDGYLANWSPNLTSGAFPSAGDFTIDAAAGPFLDGSDLALGSAVTIRSLNFTGNYITGLGIGGSEDGSATIPLTFGTAGTTILSLSGNTDFSRVAFRATAPIVLNYSGFGTVDVAANNTLQVNSVISGTGGLIKTGAGTLTLGVSNTFSGKIQINSGTVTITGAAQLGASPAAFTADSVTINGGTLSYSGSSTVESATNRGFTIGASGGTINVASGSQLGINAIISGSSVLNKTGAGTLVYGGVNTFSGTTYISDGVISSAGFSRLGGTGGLIAIDGGTLRLTYLASSIASTTVSSAATRSFQVGDGVGTIEVINSTVSGTVTTRTIKGTISNYNGEVGVLRKTGNGILALQGNATHTGGTQLNGGTLLLVNNTLGGAGGAGLTVASGATLNGAGTINGDSSFLSGSVIQMGVYTNYATLDADATNDYLGQALTSATGTFTFTGNLDISGAASSLTASFNFDLGASGISDKIALSSGTLTIGTGLLGFSDFAFTAQSGFDTGSYTLFSSTHSVVGSLLLTDVTGIINGHDATLGISQDGMSVILTVTASAVPEPATWAAIFGAAALSIAIVRRRKVAAV